MAPSSVGEAAGSGITPRRPLQSPAYSSPAACTAPSRSLTDPAAAGASHPLPAIFVRVRLVGLLGGASSCRAVDVGARPTAIAASGSLPAAGREDVASRTGRPAKPRHVAGSRAGIRRLRTPGDDVDPLPQYGIRRSPVVDRLDRRTYLRVMSESADDGQALRLYRRCRAIVGSSVYYTDFDITQLQNSCPGVNSDSHRHSADGSVREGDDHRCRD